MPDGIRSIDGEGLIPLPREVLRAKRRRPKRDKEEQDERDFEHELELEKTLRPQKRRLSEPWQLHRQDPHESAHRGDRSAEGLGADLDLLA